MHGQGVLGAHAAHHVPEDEGAAVVVHLYGHDLLVHHAGLLGLVGVEVDVAFGGDDALLNGDLAGRAPQGAAGGALQVAGLPDGGGDTQLAGVGKGDLHLGLGAGGA